MLSSSLLTSLESPIEKPAPLTQLLIRKGLDAQESVDSSFKDSDYTLARIGILYRLQQGPLSLSELAQQMHCGRSNLTSMMDKLERLKWVRRVPSSTDRRVIHAEITPLGQKTCDQGVKELKERESALIEKLGEQDATQLLLLLQKI